MTLYTLIILSSICLNCCRLMRQDDVILNWEQNIISAKVVFKKGERIS